MGPISKEQGEARTNAKWKALDDCKLVNAARSTKYEVEYTTATPYILYDYGFIVYRVCVWVTLERGREGLKD